MKRALLISFLLFMTSGCASPTTQCPEATPEAIYVYPLPATTEELSVTVLVSWGHLEQITVETESGSFTINTTEVVVDLLPDIVHHLIVEGKVERVVGLDRCVYGYYTLTARSDTNGNPIRIEQVSP